MKSAQRFGILAVLALSLCAPAFAQKPQRNETPATLYGTEMEVGSTFAVDRYGRMQCLVPASATSIAKNEDAAHASGDTGDFMLGVANETLSAFGAAGDYTPIGVTRGGGVFTVENYSMYPTALAPTSLLKLEDAVHASGDAGVPVWAVQTNTPASSGANGDYVTLNSGATGGLYVDLDARAQGTTTSPSRREDVAFGDQDGVMMAGGVNNRSFGAYNSTNGDITPFSVGDKGVLASMLMYDSSLGGGSSPIVLEDDASANAGAGLVTVGIQETTLSSAYTAGSAGDYTVTKNNEYGAQYVQIAPALDSTLSTTGITSAATNNSTNVKAGRGAVYGWSISNTTAAIKYVKLYNKATAPTCGTDTPVIRIGVPATSTVSYVNPIGINMPTGLGYCIVTGAADTDNTAVAANDIFLNLSYR